MAGTTTTEPLELVEGEAFDEVLREGRVGLVRAALIAVGVAAVAAVVVGIVLRRRR